MTKRIEKRDSTQETAAAIKAPLDHIAFIMDGNGRWAKQRGLARHFGHREGFKRVKEIAKACRGLGIKCMSLYAFSTENWNRPQDEIDFLFAYLDKFLKQELPNLIKDDCQLRVAGDITRLPLHSQNEIRSALDATAQCRTHILNICLNYGGKQDILRAVSTLAARAQAGLLNPALIDERMFEQELYTAGLPPIDLLVRTSGEVRLSNFMMYQLAYSELIFTPTYWPDFKRKELLACLAEFSLRHRRYGGL